MHTVSRGKEEHLKRLQKHDTMLLGKLPVMDRTGGPPPNAVFLQHADKLVTPAAFRHPDYQSAEGLGGVIAQPKMNTLPCYFQNRVLLPDPFKSLLTCSLRSCISGHP